MKNNMHYSKQNTAIATSEKFAARAKRGLQSHELHPLWFVLSNAFYFSQQLFLELNLM